MTQRFLMSLTRLVAGVLSPDLRPFRVATGFGLVKIYYGNAKIHYEANLQARSKTVEIGLHFEADRFTNARLLGAFRMEAKRIARELPGARLEEWDKGWTRIWEPLPYEELDGDLQRAAAGLLARYITVLEPIIRDALPADVPWKVAPAKPTRRSAARSARRG